MSEQLQRFTVMVLLIFSASPAVAQQEIIGVGVHLQPVSVWVKFSLPGYYDVLGDYDFRGSMLLRSPQTVSEIGVDWGIPYWKKRNSNEGAQMLLAAPFQLLGLGMGKREVMQRNRVQREYPDFEKFYFIEH